MHIEEMTTQECRAMLAGTHVARLACAVNNQPYIVPIHLAFDGEFFYGYSTLGRKIQWMRQNPLICLEIDAVTGNQQWESVVVFGSYEELGTTPEYENSRRQAERLFQTRPMWWEPGSVPLNGRRPGEPVVFRLQLHRMTGRRAMADAVTTEPFVQKISQTSQPSFGGVLAGRRIARTAAFAAGAIVLTWIALQMAVIGYVSWMQPATAVAGAVVIVLAWLLPHTGATRHG